MIDIEKYRDKKIHIVHSEMYEGWLSFGLSMRDRARLLSFYETLEDLKRNDIPYVIVRHTSMRYGAESGQSVIVGGAIWGSCPNDHAEYLESFGVSVEMDKDLSFTGFQDRIDFDNL